MFDEVKLALRLRGAALDNEVKRLIAAAKADLRIAGIVFDDPPENVTETITNAGQDPPPEQAAGDPLIVNAIILYCKGFSDIVPDAERHKQAYLYQKRALVLAGDYIAVK
jgi:hypothetical protein